MRPEVERHIAAMRIVMTTGCTLQEANARLAELRRRAAAQAHEEWRASLDRKAAAQRPLNRPAEAPERSEPWMMRD